MANEPIEAVFSSTLLRAQQTAAPLAARLGVTVRTYEGLREVRAGTLEMRNDAAALAIYKNSIVAWARGDWDEPMAGGETGTDVVARFEHVVNIATSQRQCAVIVSHGAAIRTWAASRVAGVTVELFQQHPLGNTGALFANRTAGNRWESEHWHQLPLGGPAFYDV